ncbi:unnamed protein product [Heligmosomoides polygyrus]|uniref:Uncharacterized protein n=1 Tax=Heligmosomoides polygyrus TaxID=6339 RepID=A0A183GN18_HELPZ|nr:unnamed protein product [Heligmosomoides polygyrus]
MDDTQYDTHVKAPRTSSTEGSVDLEAEPKEVPAPFVPTIIRENKEDVASAPVAPPKIESRYLFEAPPPYEEDPTQTQSGGQRRMVAIKLSECCIVTKEQYHHSINPDGENINSTQLTGCNAF